VLDVIVENRPKCEELRRRELDAIDQLHPDIVVLAAYWGLYNGEDGWPRVSPEQLGPTLDYLKVLGVKSIVVVGPVPSWQVTVPDAMIAWQAQSGARLIPVRLKDFLKKEPFELEPHLRAAVQRNGALYVSALSVFCNEDGCQTVSNETGHLEPLAWDYGHLTDVGSRRLAAEVLKTALSTGGFH
jgi:hypothetical protein